MKGLRYFDIHLLSFFLRFPVLEYCPFRHHIKSPTPRLTYYGLHQSLYISQEVPKIGSCSWLISDIIEEYFKTFYTVLTINVLYNSKNNIKFYWFL